MMIMSYRMEVMLSSVLIIKHIIQTFNFVFHIEIMDEFS